jgi:hypothetical protein
MNITTVRRHAAIANNIKGHAVRIITMYCATKSLFGKPGGHQLKRRDRPAIIAIPDDGRGARHF